MSDPWFDPSYAWLPGTFLGCTAGLVGGLAGWLAPRGRARTLILGSTWAFFILSAILLAAGVVGYVSGQPYGVWYGLGLAGLIGVVVIGFNLPPILGAYRRAEERRIQAHDLGN